MRSIVFLLLILGMSGSVYSQTYPFAQLTGSPVNTTGWNFTGAAAVGNMTGTGNSEIILCTNANYQSGAVFFNQPINLNLCNKWIAEFDFRIFDGDGADGIAFCFLDVPPSGFVNGGGLGIPATANGLKVCFDTYLNCATTGSATPKLELRWGPGYDECWAQPTINNAAGTLALLRSNNYCHAKIVYNNGNIEVYLNNILYLSGFQQFSFTGYLGFTASTGGSKDNHSIKNVNIYTAMPPSEAGPNQSVCNGQTITLGTAPDPLNIYSWSPATDLSASNIANPVLTGVNTTTTPIVRKYYVNTSFNNSGGCTSFDSVTVTINPAPGITIVADNTTVCTGSTVNFTATLNNAGTSPNLQWQVNGVNAGTNSSNFSTSTLSNGDVVTCLVSDGGTCNGNSNPVTINVTPGVTPTISISGGQTACAGSNFSFTATTSNGGTAPVYQWKNNGVAVGTNSSSYSSTSISNGDVITCELTSNAGCLATPNASSNPVTVTVTQPVTPTITISGTQTACAGSALTFTAAITNGGTAPVYQWKKNGVATGSNASSFTSSALANGDVITCTLTSNQTCITSANASSNGLTITINALPVVTLDHTPTLCTGATRTLDAGSYSAYLWNDGTTTQTNTVSAAGNYSVTVTDNNGCKGTDAVSISLLPLPAGFLPSDSAVCDQANFTIRSLSAFTSYLWSNGTTLSTLPANQAGTYWLEVVDNSGCKGRDSIIYTVKNCDARIFYPTAFTPDGNGKNDIFKPVVRGVVDQYEFRIYNRWGQHVFSTSNPQRGWDGSISGSKQNTGAFVWTCTYRFVGGTTQKDKGSFVLIR